MGKVWDRRVPDHNTQQVLLKLADHADQEGNNVRPSAESVAYYTQLSERTVRRVLKWLRDEKVLIVVRAGGGKGNPTEYRLDLDALPIKPPYHEHRDTLKGATAAPYEDPEGCTDDTESKGVIVAPFNERVSDDAPKGCQDVHSKGVTVAPEPIKQPQEQPLTPQPPAQRGADEGSDQSKGALRALGQNPRALRREQATRDGLRRWVARLAEAFVADDDPGFVREQLAYQLEQQTDQPADVRADLVEAGIAAWLRIHETQEVADAR